MKKIDDDVKYREKLRNQVNTARAERKAMMTERDASIAQWDATVLALQELKEQTLNLMSQPASTSTATLLGILKSYNPMLDTSLVTFRFNGTSEEAVKLVESVQLIVPAFVESLRLSL